MFVNPILLSATKPGQAPQIPVEKKKTEKDRGFKTAPDGRLIIKDDSDSDDDDETKKPKINLNSDDSDTDDGKSAAETLLLTDRKRKRSSGSVKSAFSSISSQPPMKYKPGGVGIHR